MNKRLWVQSVLAIIACLFLFGCAVKKIPEMPSYTYTTFDTGMYNSKVDNFIVVFDASSTMAQRYKETTKFDIAKEIAHRLNLTIPEMGQTGGLRSFGHDPRVSKQETELLYGREQYSTLNLKDTLDVIIKPGGVCSLGTAVKEVGKDLYGFPGNRNAVIIISDGMVNEMKNPTLQALRETYGSTISFYPIQVGDAPEGTAYLQELSRLDGRGFYTTSDRLMTEEGMANFVERVFLTPKYMAGGAAPRVVHRTTNRNDSDGDGVYDDMDQCPGTPAGANVNDVGCWILDSVLFDFDRADIKAEGYPLLDGIVAILKKNPGMRVELQGHTDNVGTEAYNMDLSIRRANSVAKYLVSKGIMKNRLVTTGFGFKSPAAQNKTSFGRSLNRRVELHPY